MIIAKKYRIGGYEIPVEYEKDCVRNREALGYYDPYQCVIRLDADAPAQMKRETLVHELIEATNAIYELSMPHAAITTLSIALHQALTTGEGDLDAEPPKIGFKLRRKEK